jgi:hypothetical protein
MSKVDVTSHSLISVLKVLALRGGQRFAVFENRAKRIRRPKREIVIEEIDK